MLNTFISLEETQMAQVVYRGVSYDTERHVIRDASYVRVPQVYRGVQHSSVIKIEEAQK